VRGQTQRMHFALLLMLAMPSDVHLIPGTFTPGSQPDGNTVIFDAPRGLIVVDTGRHAEHTQKILDFATNAKKPIAAVINTHWHLDHIGGNPRIREAYPDAKIYASGALSDALDGFLKRYRGQLEQMVADTKDPEQQKTFRTEMALIDAGAKLAPDEVVKASGTRTIAGRKLDLNLDHNAVTAADVWVYDAKTRVVAAGDLVTLPAPFLDTACPAGWSAELARVAKTPFEVLIPGHGTPMTREQFATYRNAFDALLTCAKSDQAKSSCVDGWIAATRPLQPDADEKFTGMLMNYYVDVLRKEPFAACR
jgi:glyoxylase-like metal-dependent hydrolase (beta-lactamase superfamily II)